MSKPYDMKSVAWFERNEFKYAPRVRATVEALQAARARQDISEVERKLLAQYRIKRSVDGSNGRPWNAGMHFDADVEVARLEGLLAAQQQGEEGGGG